LIDERERDRNKEEQVVSCASAGRRHLFLSNKLTHELTRSTKQHAKAYRQEERWKNSQNRVYRGGTGDDRVAQTTTGTNAIAIATEKN
jgi:DNA repair photolyase